eukprot:705570-Rhodomonas_salina.1
MSSMVGYGTDTGGATRPVTEIRCHLGPSYSDAPRGLSSIVVTCKDSPTKPAMVPWQYPVPDQTGLAHGPGRHFQ